MLWAALRLWSGFRYIHPCEICGRIFNSIGNLERHKLIHTGRCPPRGPRPRASLAHWPSLQSSPASSPSRCILLSLASPVLATSSTPSIASPCLSPLQSSGCILASSCREAAFPPGFGLYAVTKDAGLTSFRFGCLFVRCEEPRLRAVWEVLRQEGHAEGAHARARQHPGVPVRRVRER